MNSRTLLVLLPLAAMAAALAACSGPKTTFTTSSIETTGVTVSGHGEVEMTPDTGFFTVGVEVHAKSVAEARDGAARAADKVIASLKSNKVDEKDIKTSGLSINPQYDYNKNGGQPTIVGYIVSNTVEVKVRKLDSFSKLVDDAASAGGDNVRLQGASPLRTTQRPWSKRVKAPWPTPKRRPNSSRRLAEFRSASRPASANSRLSPAATWPRAGSRQPTRRVSTRRRSSRARARSRSMWSSAIP